MKQPNPLRRCRWGATHRLVALSLMAVLAAPAAQADTRVLLNFPTIVGASQLANYSNQIPLESFSFSAGRACGGGDPSGDLFCVTPQSRPLTLVKTLDSSDAALTLQAFSGTPVNLCISVVSISNDPASPSTPIEELRIGKALVSDIGLAVTANGELRRTVTLAYEAFDVTTYKANEQTGAVEIENNAGWSFRNNGPANDADLGSAECKSP